MKRKLLLLLVMLASVVSMRGQNEPKAYGVYIPYDAEIEASGTFTIYYDNKYYEYENNYQYEKFYGSNLDLDFYYSYYIDGVWLDLYDQASEFIIDSSYAKLKPTEFHIGGPFMTKITGLEYLNTENLTSISFFSLDLTSLDLSNFDTSNVKDMSRMFKSCCSLTSLNLSNFNTHNVTDMSYMFSGCPLLTNLDVSNFDTSNVNDMSYMFSGCSSLTNLDVSNFDTSNVKDMSGMFCDYGYDFLLWHPWLSEMFRGYSSPASLDLSSFDTQNVVNMSYMFSGFSSLTDLDVSNFDTNNVKDMNHMFSGCSSLTSLDVSNFDTSNVKDMSHMFYGCSSLTNLDVSNFDTSNVNDMRNMFSGCSSLTNLDVSNFDTSNVIHMDSIFGNCSSLKSLYISASMENISDNACIGVGTETSPCVLIAPTGFNFGVDTSGDYFIWKGGFFTLMDDQKENIFVTTNLGYITYCSNKSLDFTNVEGMKAYIVVGYDGKVAKLSRIGIVPPETGLLLKADAGEYEVPYTEEDNYVMNMLIGVLEETTLSPTEGNMTNLVLANGKNGLGFYCLKGSGTIAAHRAYLQVPTRLIGNDAKFISMEFDDDVTAISGITTQEETAPYYDLQGVRHQGKPTKHGIYIQNGKKVVVRD